VSAPAPWQRPPGLEAVGARITGSHSKRISTVDLLVIAQKPESQELPVLPPPGYPGASHAVPRSAGAPAFGARVQGPALRPAVARFRPRAVFPSAAGLRAPAPPPGHWSQCPSCRKERIRALCSRIQDLSRPDQVRAATGSPRCGSAAVIQLPRNRGRGCPAHPRLGRSPGAPCRPESSLWGEPLTAASAS